MLLKYPSFQPISKALQQGLTVMYAGLGLFTVSLTVLLLFPNNLQGQSYESILAKDSLVYTLSRQPSTPNAPLGTIRKKTFSDTTYAFRGHSYKRLVAKDTLDRPLREIYVREDTSKGKVWALNITDLPDSNGFDTTERLVMDLSLDKTDSFKIPYDRTILGIGSSYATVDSVFFIQGHKAINFMIQEKADFTGSRIAQMTFIEGIGPTMGFYFCPLPDFTTENCLVFNDLLCLQTKNKFIFRALDTTVYSQKDPIIFNEKQLVYTGKNCFNARIVERFEGKKDPGKEEKIVKVFPQPAQNVVHFQAKQRIDGGMVSIYNLQWQKVLEKRLQRPETTIRKPGKGNFYLYQVRDKDHKLLDKGKLLFYKASR